jgi:cytochrome bd-type quinol oxidase subunit 2
VSAAEFLIGVMWLALTCYVVLAGADFGGVYGICWPAAPEPAMLNGA